MFLMIVEVKQIYHESFLPFLVLPSFRLPSLFLPSHQTRYESELINSLLDASDIAVRGISHYRMKNPFNMQRKTGSLRLLKLIFPTKRHQPLFVSKRASLRRDSQFKGINIRPSLTREQKERQYLLKEEKCKLVSQGKDYVIFNGELVP